ncbi:hypothetical protein K504DRAFT_428853 [Pleomassaria siparia CBS 279.74]|uniref:Uncharacterized protein n=1 Tax=Pleomassaria siparia CBS 279.74 TaxID=1314801 RepID=A0A6G1KGI1_9PLEO|nr:hypothetical protein K504DRAFT_428853 [Pleomassaria siparia CBS 279.74]
MRYSSIILASAIATSFASPLAKRDEVTFDPNGNLKLTFSKETVTLGTITIDDVASQLGQACHESGQCETSEISIKGQLLSSSTVNNIVLTLGPSGAYPTWIRNGLLDSMYAAVKAIAKCEETTHTSTCANPMVYCPQHKITVTQCKVPKYWGVNYQDPNEATSAPPAIGTNLEVELVDDGICEAAMTSLGAVAGAVNGVAGGFFTLLGFACQ